MQYTLVCWAVSRGGLDIERTILGLSGGLCNPRPVRHVLSFLLGSEKIKTDMQLIGLGLPKMLQQTHVVLVVKGFGYVFKILIEILSVTISFANKIVSVFDFLVKVKAF